ncbi:hypothetical protein [Streptomyces sp. NBC_01506]|uniref:hypothetical protein n=1 Tax=Streptomyces sp. NBC_01506 TaxID=2903887 RepID=UPI003870E01A
MLTSGEEHPWTLQVVTAKYSPKLPRSWNGPRVPAAAGKTYLQLYVEIRAKDEQRGGTITDQYTSFGIDHCGKPGRAGIQPTQDCSAFPLEYSGVLTADQIAAGEIDDDIDSHDWAGVAEPGVSYYATLWTEMAEDTLPSEVTLCDSQQESVWNACIPVRVTS